MPTGNMVAGVLQTNAQAVKALLICRQTIDDGRVTVAGTTPSVFGIDMDIGGDMLRQQGGDLLDAAQAYVEGLIAINPNDDSPVTPDTRRYVETAVDTVTSDLGLLRDVKASVGTTFQESLQELIDEILKLAGAVGGAIANVLPWYIWAGLGLVVVMFVYLAAKK